MQTSDMPQDAASQALRQSLEKTFAQNTAFFTEMAHFTRAESLRMAQRNLDRAHTAFSRLEERRNLADLIGAQQEWMREVMRDYTVQGFRYMGLFRGLAQSARAQAEHAASQAAHETHESAQAFAQESEAVMHEVQSAAE